MPDHLLDDEGLERSDVVANCAMNRERQLAGANSYAKELGFNPLDRLIGVAAPGEVAWLDLCCGRGRPLIQAAERVRREGLDGRVRIVGVDLVDYFDPAPAGSESVLELVCASIVGWTPRRRFDLITCVHGLHYVGDKLGVLARAASWLTAGGLFVADLDLANVRVTDRQPVAAALRRAGFSYDARRHRVTRKGHGTVDLPFRYLGADHRAGANYTGQPVVDSHYEPVDA